MDIAELKKKLWEKYVLAKMFTDDSKDDWLQVLMPKEQASLKVEEPMAKMSVNDNRFKALREKLQQRQEQPNEDVNAETGRTE